MKKVIFIGKTGSGKTTLCQKIHEEEINYKKTQVVEYYNMAIDTPGEYLERRNYYSAIIVSSADADCICLVADPTVEENYIPPGFAGTFNKEVIGVITKQTLIKDDSLLERAKEQLKSAGVEKIFIVDTVYNIGIKQLIDYLN